ncbi:endolytic transglycosylase MltG [Sphingomonas oligophenolica]|uniref:Endolytic murein transglycosylase n=1 Tax=Sphingomonas oligophenolica TaxID=301154 RepID=A0A502CCU7_9SPHN|nr:endolytic transglycosylase MltG [Sphingomonas oligophenolica]TPG09606.1 endolytic transglycosylase MltG [Sphingomonas oligophenolica]
MRKAGCLVLLIGLAAIAVLFGVVQSWGGSGPAPRTLTVQIKDGTTLGGAAKQLAAAGAVPSATRFRIYARLFGSGEPIKTGEYRLPAHISQSDILKLLQGGKTLQRLVVVPEGYPSVMVHDALMKADGLTGSVAVPVEGSILPDSYAFQRGDTRASVVARMQQAMRGYLAAAWAKRKPGIAVSTPEQAIILASIVEKETGKPSERRTVAAVYGNRLKRGMPLQADPTVIYPITKGRPLGRRILRSELQAKNGYNTYASPGLPVGPIANPGRASIDAVLDPGSSQALYFVADGTGGHVFADTLAQHNANVQKWYAIRKARGEM